MGLGLRATAANVDTFTLLTASPTRERTCGGLNRSGARATTSGMMMLTRTLLAAALVPGLVMLPSSLAWAGAPMDAAQDPTFAEPPPEPDGQALHMTESLPAPDPASPPAIELPDLEPELETAPAPELGLAPQPSPSWPPTVDRKRPFPGRGLIVLGGFTLAATSMLAMTALAGPGWIDLDRDDAMIMGLSTLPLALAGAGMVVGGSKAARRYDAWASDYQLSPPRSGNGMLVAGSMMTLGFIGSAAYGVHWAQQQPSRSRGDWAPTIVSGVGAVVGVMLLSGGMLQRSKFVRWDRAGYVMPGPMAMKHGAGLSISGRF